MQILHFKLHNKSVYVYISWSNKIHIHKDVLSICKLLFGYFRIILDQKNKWKFSCHSTYFCSRMKGLICLSLFSLQFCELYLILVDLVDGCHCSVNSEVWLILVPSCRKLSCLLPSIIATLWSYNLRLLFFFLIKIRSNNFLVDIWLYTWKNVRRMHVKECS